MIVGEMYVIDEFAYIQDILCGSSGRRRLNERHCI